MSTKIVEYILKSKWNHRSQMNIKQSEQPEQSEIQAIEYQVTKCVNQQQKRKLRSNNWES